MQHIAILDGLRGFAALLVFLAHAAHYGFLPAFLSSKLGAAGVGVFFVLSGFLMAYLYVEQKPTAAALKAYFINRLSRVLPLYFTVLLGGAVIVLVSGQTVYGFTDLPSFLSNLFLVQGTGVLWSVPIEIHYYVCFAAIWWCTPRWGSFTTVLAMLAMQAVFIFVTPPLASDVHRLIYFLHLFLIGHMVGVLFRRRPDGFLAQHGTSVSWALGGAAFGVFILLFDGAQSFLAFAPSNGFRDPLVSVFAVLLLLAALVRAPLLSLFETRFMCFLGRISYSLYLLHIVVILVAYGALDLEGQTAFPLFVPLFLVCLGASWASHSWIERPAQGFFRARLSGSGASFQRD